MRWYDIDASPLLRAFAGVLRAWAYKLMQFGWEYWNHWILKSVVFNVTAPVADYLSEAAGNIEEFADKYDNLIDCIVDILNLGDVEGFLANLIENWVTFRDHPLWWILDLLEGPFPGIRLFLPDPVDYIRRTFSSIVFPDMRVDPDWRVWLYDIGDEIMPGFRLFVPDPADFIRRTLSDRLFPGMYVSPDWRRWLWDVIDWIFPGIWEYLADIRGYTLRWIADALDVPHSFWDWPWRWFLYKWRNEMEERHDYIIKFLREFGESVLRFMFEGVW